MLSFDPTPFDFFGAFLYWLIAFVVVALIFLIVAFLMAAISGGVSGIWLFLKITRDTVLDVVGLSPRRTWAITRLTILEAVRGKALYVGVVFAILYLFAGWFTAGVGDDPDLALKVYVGFVLRTISWLILPVVLILGCWGLPADIKARSLHTVVTKPVRRNEIVIGRVLGYCFVGWMALLVMGGVGYIWMMRALPGGVRSELQARVPIYGFMTFRDRQGVDSNAGINTGDEFQFRSFIEGNTKSRAIWDFENPSWAERRNSDELTVGGHIVPGDTFEMRSGDTHFVRVKAATDAASSVAAELARQWNEKQSKESGVTATADGNLIRVTQNDPARHLHMRVRVETVPDPTLKPGEKRVAPEFSTGQLLVESSFQSFRTYKGNIERGLLCQYFLLNESAVVTIPDSPAGLVKIIHMQGTNTVDIKAKTPQEAARILADAINKFGKPEYDKQGELQIKAPFKSISAVVGTNPNDKTKPAVWLDSKIAGRLGELQMTLPTGWEFKQTRLEAPLAPFEVREYRKNEYPIRRDLATQEGRPLDLFNDLIFNDNTGVSRLRVEARCLTSAQFLGMARPDLMVRLPSKSFFEGYAKAVLGIGLMMTCVITLGVVASCFVKGPVACMLTLFVLGMGAPGREFLNFLVDPKNAVGGGIFESTYRIFAHLNPTTALPNTWGVWVIQKLDYVQQVFLAGLNRFLPDFRQFWMDDYVASAFDVPWNAALAPCLAMTIGFVLPLLLLGHISLKVRELEHK